MDCAFFEVSSSASLTEKAWIIFHGIWFFDDIKMNEYMYISKIFYAVARKEKKIGFTVKILKFRTPQTIAIIVLRIEKFDETLH